MISRLALASAAAFLLSTGIACADALSKLGGRYSILPSSRIAFSVGQVGGGGINGAFSQFSGSFDLHPEAIARSRVAFSLTPASVMAREPRIENFLRSSAVFDVAEYPVITFRSARVIPEGANNARIEGVLSARGKSAPAVFEATLVRHHGPTVEFHVVGEIFRSRYGMDVGVPIYSNIVRFDMTLRGDRR